MPTVACLSELRCLLGEGPVWDEAERRLWLVDIKAPAVHRLDPNTGAVETWPQAEPVGALALRERGGLLLSLKSGIHLFDPTDGGLTRVAAPEPHLPGNRLNDAKCDGRGRYWVGSMDDAERAPTGHLYRLDPDFTITAFEAGFSVTNGPAFSPDGRTLFFTDSDGGAIYAYDFDLEAGRPSERRLFVQVPPADGFPDGMCCDSEGHLWVAHWEGARLTRYTSAGAVDRVVEIPAPRVTSCCFGGPALDVLYVTTAHIGLDEAQDSAYPLSGRVFAITGLGVAGLPMPRFAG